MDIQHVLSVSTIIVNNPHIVVLWNRQLLLQLKVSEELKMVWRHLMLNFVVVLDVVYTSSRASLSVSKKTEFSINPR